MGRFAAESEIIFTIDAADRKFGLKKPITITAAIRNIYSELFIRNSFSLALRCRGVSSLYFSIALIIYTDLRSFDYINFDARVIISSCDVSRAFTTPAILPEDIT